MKSQSLVLNDFFTQAVSPLKEMAAYEALWDQDKATFKSIADRIKSCPGSMPSTFVPDSEIQKYSNALKDIISQYNVNSFGIRIKGANEYPERLCDARHPVEVLYYQGFWNLVETPCVAVVGSRKVSKEGIARTRKMVRNLVADGYTIVSGLAEGVDRAAHEAAIEYGGQTIAVIGTPISHYYPKENKDLQDLIRTKYLLISQVPFKRYIERDYRHNRTFFPERNVTMSALCLGTIIVEASDTSGTLYQARAALAQGRKLFILDSCFKNKNISWPEKYLKKGVIRVRDYEDVRQGLASNV
ncbi:DNA-processing protein DprA [Gynuella sunshinyii]|uniref:Putative Rossmann fold nucleotide-binding protein involved in DNA uptake n=1 Tax=Gynuella sunshinyii YC6258 TaxID=1445510 RepID=A0A0C5VCU1_9GAMM|nr:DNA-processing protein DprA [Gynuella sunshinyii]AJQ92297.1 putative Rossmann fold nucleotide-binding protein involved in DNA uptake [Gynuella sunshinyii YC6258]